MAILIEHLAGKWPFWISPRQIIVCPISEKFIDYCESVYLYLHKEGFEVELDKSNVTLNKKVRNAQIAQWNYILVAGEEEVKTGTVDVRTRDGKREGKFRVDDLVTHLKSLYPKQSQSYFNFYEKIWKPEDHAKEEEAKKEPEAKKD